MAYMELILTFSISQKMAEIYPYFVTFFMRSELCLVKRALSVQMSSHFRLKTKTQEAFMLKNIAKLIFINRSRLNFFQLATKWSFYPIFYQFFNSVALLCSTKKPKSGTKILVFRFNQKSLNDFIMYIQIF